MKTLFVVKTRNWHGNKKIDKLIAFPYKFFGYKYEPAIDFDTKHFITTNSITKGLLLWSYWKMLSIWSGGWTYILNQNKQYNLSSYKNFYL